MDPELIRISKFLSFVLRHEPDSIGLTLDANGWVPVDELLRAAEAHGRALSIDQLEAVVAQNDKRRFVLSDGRVRASQGHSVEVDLGLAARVPPQRLFHGTASRFLSAILAEGLRPMNRHHVHLSSDRETAAKVGARHGEAVVLRVASGAMAAAGHEFFRSSNGVWLTDHVAPAFLEECGDRRTSR